MGKHRLYTNPASATFVCECKYKVAQLAQLPGLFVDLRDVCISLSHNDLCILPPPPLLLHTGSSSDSTNTIQLYTGVVCSSLFFFFSFARVVHMSLSIFGPSPRWNPSKRPPALSILMPPYIMRRPAVACCCSSVCCSCAWFQDQVESRNRGPIDNNGAIMTRLGSHACHTVRHRKLYVRPGFL